MEATVDLKLTSEELLSTDIIQGQKAINRLTEVIAEMVELEKVILSAFPDMEEVNVIMFKKHE